MARSPSHLGNGSASPQSAVRQIERLARRFRWTSAVNTVVSILRAAQVRTLSRLGGMNRLVNGRSWMNHGSPCLTALLVTSMAFGSSEAGSARDGDFRRLVDFFQGSWTCGGHFANGTAIFSDEAFESVLDGAWMQEVHHDHPPFSYHAYSMWGVDSGTHKLTLTIHDSSGGLRTFASPNWDQATITFDVPPISVPAGKKERFIYVQQPPDSFSFEYQRGTDSGDWKMGDHIDCKRKL
jgi:hypothetical protein